MNLLVLTLNVALFGAADDSRIVTLGASVTELVYALGAGEKVVGVDATSLYPAEAESVRTLGYYRQVASEGILSLRPTLVLALEGSGPPEALESVKRAGVEVRMVPQGHGREELRRKFEAVGEALGEKAAATALVRGVLQQLDELTPSRTPPRVLFIYARGRGALSVSGEDTSAATIIDWVGARNAVTGYDGYRPLTAEAVVAAKPDVLLVTSRGLESLGGIDGVLRAPGVALTPAGRARRIVAIDDLQLLGFGPRLGDAAERLHRALHGSGEG